ncbi:MAG: RdgB/HAM1 family non-canonical purine NTP pyrophosphatase [Desulfovibrio sp.]|jgi:XTP/dITP diphosphohydrolase|nr:RdgB/HAM1 family non-canonical purine NTP pyrophosphatase [Desulfovibrio sp.]
MSEQTHVTGRSTIVLATRNKGKIREFSELLLPFGLKVLGFDDFPHLPEIRETGMTFAENALLKAREASEVTGLVAVADDSGLEVDILGKIPGVRSARYSELPGVPATDEGNVKKLLAALEDVPREQRKGRFRCCMAACAPTGEHLLAEGNWEGMVALRPSGSNGFGYDPVFFDEEQGCTAAEMRKEEKNARSHRAKAVAALLRRWPAFWRRWLAGCALVR